MPDLEAALRDAQGIAARSVRALAASLRGAADDIEALVHEYRPIPRDIQAAMPLQYRQIADLLEALTSALEMALTP